MYLSLFISAFAAATILPAQSEALLAYQVSISPDAVVQLVAIATLGNVLGATFNWWLGRLTENLRATKWFPVNQKTAPQSRAILWTLWSLFFVVKLGTNYWRSNYGSRRNIARATFVLCTASDCCKVRSLCSCRGTCSLSSLIVWMVAIYIPFIIANCSVTAPHQCRIYRTYVAV